MARIGVTGSLDVAMSNGYLGELTLWPTRIAWMVRTALGGGPLSIWRQYYYGRVEDAKRDPAMRRLFGYPETS